ncbi:Cullin-domain-containing protein [Sanghuangporus baumii]|uniref:Cullin-domain-containing protein n=1 Tax=Sanghuangporus baumii TaxID=108892 RepID=A0A9Q5HZF2_SANBA|nr:Cullin-domain-containing protein [Sanghuangporus baumii]
MLVSALDIQSGTDRSFVKAFEEILRPLGIYLSQVPADLRLEQDDIESVSSFSPFQDPSHASRRPLMCLGLCTNLRKYLVEHLKIVREGAESLIDEYLLRYYAEEWNKYTTGATYINRLFTVLNRHWLALVQWKQNVLDRIQSENAKLSSAMIGRIEKERNGETIDQTLLRKVIDSFVSLGINEVGSNKQSLDMYEEHFQAPFIAATENYYRQESVGLLIANSVSDYLKKVEER